MSDSPPSSSARKSRGPEFVRRLKSHWLIALLGSFVTSIGIVVAIMTNIHSMTAKPNPTNVGVSVATNSGIMNINNAATPMDSADPCVRAVGLGFKCSADGLAEAISGGNEKAIADIVAGGVNLDAEGSQSTVQMALAGAPRHIQISTLNEMKRFGLTGASPKVCYLPIDAPDSSGRTTSTRAGCSLSSNPRLYCALKAVGLDDPEALKKLRASSQQKKLALGTEYDSKSSGQACLSNPNSDPEAGLQAADCEVSPRPNCQARVTAMCLQGAAFFRQHSPDRTAYISRADWPSQEEEKSLDCLH